MTVPPALRLRLDRRQLAANWRWLAARAPGAACGAAIKADGYGLGAREVMANLFLEGCRDFFVSTWAEIEALGPIPGGVSVSVLHGVRRADLDFARTSSARPVLNSVEQVALWRAAGGGACDVMVDTGMNRLGLSPAEARSGILDGLPIQTLLSHLACADEPGHPLNDRQAALFASLRGTIPARRYSLANSAGIMLGSAYTHDLLRPGIALYGGHPVAGMAGIGAVVTIEAQIIQRRRVSAGDSVGYGATFTAIEPRDVAILNIGYADGYFRAFAGSGTARAGDKPCPLLGRVSMDLVAVDVTGVDAAAGEWLALDFDLPHAAEATGLSQYELLTSLGHRFQRQWI